MSNSELENVVLDVGVWPSDETKARREYSTCVRHMSEAIKEHNKTPFYQQILYTIVGLSCGVLVASVGSSIARDSQKPPPPTAAEALQTLFQNDEARDQRMEKIKSTRMKKQCEVYKEMRSNKVKFHEGMCFSERENGWGWELVTFP